MLRFLGTICSQIPEELGPGDHPVDVAPAVLPFGLAVSLEGLKFDPVKVPVSSCLVKVIRLSGSPLSCSLLLLLLSRDTGGAKKPRKRAGRRVRVRVRVTKADGSVPENTRLLQQSPVLRDRPL